MANARCLARNDSGAVPLANSVAAPSADDSASMMVQVRADWEAQEKRRGRALESAEAIQAAVERASRLREDLLAMGPAVDIAAETVQLGELAARAADSASLSEAIRRDLYFQIRTVTRQLVLKNPLVSSQPILFMQRHRAVGYMLYEYLGWYYAYGYDPTNGAKNAQFATPPTGGGVYVLEEPGRSFKTTPLTDGKLPAGHFVTLALSYDARTIYFAHADPSGEDPYDSPGFVQASAERGTRYNTFHIFAMQCRWHTTATTHGRSARRFRSVPAAGRWHRVRIHAARQQAAVRRRKSGAGVYAASHGWRRTQRPHACRFTRRTSGIPAC